MNTLRQLRVILYRLKMSFGLPVNIIVDQGAQHDLETGQIVPDDKSFRIRRAIIPPSKQIRDFVYDLSFIAANKNFTYGGFFDTSTRMMILDGQDLPSDYEPTINDRCVFEGKRYNYKEVHALVQEMGYIIVMQQLDSQIVENVETIRLGQGIRLESTTESENA